jgi:uncharacterized C2H2 Zn-finger protein
MWLFFCFVTARMAQKKGRPAFWFFLLAFLASPLIGMICAALADTDQVVLDRRRLAGNQVKRCPHCGELIRRQATICRFCNRDFPSLGNAGKQFDEI